jgi:malate dehydrogenase (oxaloacetate-decarboxylating)
MGEQRDLEGLSTLVTGAPTGAIRASGSWLRVQRVVMLGASSAAIGVADMMRRQMAAVGVPDTEAYHRFFIVDMNGLLTDDRSDLSAEQRSYVQPARRLDAD